MATPNNTLSPQRAAPRRPPAPTQKTKKKKQQQTNHRQPPAPRHKEKRAKTRTPAAGGREGGGRATPAERWGEGAVALRCEVARRGSSDGFLWEEVGPDLGRRRRHGQDPGRPTLDQRVVYCRSPHVVRGCVTAVTLDRAGCRELHCSPLAASTGTGLHSYQARMSHRLLFLSHRLPFPPHNGAAIRTFNILRLLARHYDITGLCFDRFDAATAHWAQAERVAGVAHLGRFTVFPIPQEVRRGRLLWDHVRSVATRRAYTFYIHDSRSFDRALSLALNGSDYDLVHVDSLDLVRLLDRLPLERVVLTHHNVESILLHRRAAAERSAMRRAYVAAQARLLEQEERRWAPRVALNVVVSEADRETLEAIAPGARCIVVPNGVDAQYFTPAQGPKDGIVFVGGTSYFPNLDAIRWLGDSILPELRARGFSGTVTVIGRATERERAEFNAIPGLHLTGYVDDIRPYLERAAVFVAPLRVGGGTRLKLVDAWAMGTAVVSTTIGAEGLAVEDGSNILLRDEPKAFAK